MRNLRKKYLKCMTTPTQKKISICTIRTVRNNLSQIKNNNKNNGENIGFSCSIFVAKKFLYSPIPSDFGRAKSTSKLLDSVHGLVIS